MKSAVRLAVTAGLAVTVTMPIAGQKISVADIAKQMSGTWTINRALSPAFGPGRGAGRVGPAYAIAGLAFQGRRGGGGGEPTASSAADLTPAELAERTAMARLRQLAPKITIAATTESFAISDERGEQTCAVNDKNQKLHVGDTAVNAKCRWDKDKLRQEFSATTSKLVRTWGLDADGRLVMKGKLEGMNQNTLEAAAVFDRSDK